MKSRYCKFIDDHIRGHKIPRKAKKVIFGKRLSKKKLKEKIASVRYTKEGYALDKFCPECGCEHWQGTGNMTEYPEHWENFHCVRCGIRVAVIDNSPLCHLLDKQ